MISKKLCHTHLGSVRFYSTELQRHVGESKPSTSSLEEEHHKRTGAQKMHEQQTLQLGKLSISRKNEKMAAYIGPGFN